MKKNYGRLIGIVLAVILIAGVIWWQFNKKSIVKNEITKAVSKGTGSTYYIHYDSSNIDALAGNASFYNIVLQSDSLQKELYTDDTSGYPKTIFNVRIEKLAIVGADISSFLQKNKIEANSIELIRPVITIINTGKDEPVKFTAADTLALYEKITGNFKSIQAKEIKITDGTIAFAKGKKRPHTNMQGVNVTLQNLKIDSTKNYDNIVSYFIKDIVVKVKSINTKNEKLKQAFIFETVEYNAPKRFVSVQKFLQKDERLQKTMMALENTRVTGLSTNAFILNKQLKADSIITAGGEIIIYKAVKKTGGNETIEINNNFFDQAIVKNIRIGNTTLTVLNRANANEKPVVLKNVLFNAADIDSIYSGTDMMELLTKSKWNFKADGISFLSKDKVYNIQIGVFELDKIKQSIKINTATVTPTMSEATFVNKLKFQKDLFNVQLKNIYFAGVDLTSLLDKKTLIADHLAMEPIIKVFNDKTVTPDTANKIGKFPYQSMMTMPTQFYIKNVQIKNGYISYRERGAISKDIGDVFFSNVNGSINNITNMASYIKQQALMEVNVTTKFLNIAAVRSQWKIPLNANDGAFNITGNVGSFDGTKLNPIIEPLGMGSIKSGTIKSFNFNLRGNDLKTVGEAVMLYNDLKIKLLKSKDEEIKNKTVTSFVANLIIKDQNPSNGKTRTGKIDFNRVVTKSFFNLVWKSIFDGAKKSTR